MSDWLGTGPLVGDRVTLRPFTIDDADALARVVGDPARFRWVPGVPTDADSAAGWISAALADPQRRVAFAVIDNTDGRLVGSTSFYDIDPANLSVAIGYTFYAEDVQGTEVNPTAKYLLMHHAFEQCGAVRLVWHTHESNTQSRAAIAKLGATFEGLLRKHRRFGDGWRTTAQFAMIDEDWPAAKAALRKRIRG
ncbi:GNAT family N-acetyltransferase [Gordonia polyisoprenivorans]|uniref:GNAT family N-acetyltransferase n=1 Tax=Gordonia polyisoprenivorans TaxID=84595 RepID=UPI002300B8BC|nr:GNAT family protein [Gordonia polyisoprenivorans]WCB37402.1 GNAT family protein [Gordonia polyisoprenivorans]